MASKLTNNVATVKLQLNSNRTDALKAVGAEAVAMIRDQMLSGYHKAPYDTGNLFRSIDYQIKSADTVAVGTDVDYGKYVHEGTYKMAARPFIRDALVGNADMLEDAAAKKMKQGF